VCADSLIASGHLPAPVVAQLLFTDEPIGRVVIAHGLPLEREPMTRFDSDRTLPAIGGEAALARAYWLCVDGTPAMAIREWFLPSVLEALVGRKARR
jgi:chorismate-pyruvate lyase